LTRDLHFDALLIRFEAIYMFSMRIAKQQVGLGRADGQQKEDEG